nr:hypothetical protein [Tanacetum cinerariifolium]
MGYSQCYWIMATSLFFLIERCQPYQSSSFRCDDSVHQNQKGSLKKAYNAMLNGREEMTDSWSVPFVESFSD